VHLQTFWPLLNQQLLQLTRGQVQQQQQVGRAVKQERRRRKRMTRMLVSWQH
jgi:hypothetical protein